MGVVAVVQVFSTCTQCCRVHTCVSFFAEGSLHVVCLAEYCSGHS